MTKEIKLVEILTDRYRNNPLWTSLFESIGRVLETEVTEPRKLLQRIRDPDSLHVGDNLKVDGQTGRVIRIVHRESVDGQSALDDVYVDVPGVGEVVVPLNAIQERHYLIKNAKLLGFDFFSDTLSNEDLQRIVKFAATYWPEAGNENFIRFLNFIKNIELEMVQLWSLENDDSEDFEILEEFSAGEMTPVWEGGGHYPTSHVELQYDPIKYTSIDINDIHQLFYLLAPIHLVLERIAATLHSEQFTLALAAQLQMISYSHWRQGSAAWDFEAVCLGLAAQISHLYYSNERIKTL